MRANAQSALRSPQMRLARSLFGLAATAGDWIGVDLHKAAALRHTPRFVRDALEYRRRSGPRFPFAWSEIQPIVNEYRSQAGVARGHYFHQDLWAARRIYREKPPSHIDIGSRVDGFVAHVLTFMPVTVIDIRPLQSDVEGLTFVQGDMCLLDAIPTGSVPSLSCLHALEHVGLGRYGDPVDPDGWVKALRELSRILAPGGRLYLGVPVGRERVHFNSQRVFAPATIVAAVPELRLLRFSAIDDGDDFVEEASVEAFATVNYSCGLFELTKPSAG
jgi:SAM-dependent methyltransferase